MLEPVLQQLLDLLYWYMIAEAVGVLAGVVFMIYFLVKVFRD